MMEYQKYMLTVNGANLKTPATKVIANRIWKKIFGRGLVEPIDDWRDDTVASIPEL